MATAPRTSKAKTLPPNPSLDQLKKQAKELLAAYRAADPDALRELRTAVPRFAAKPAATLADAQHALARRYDLPTWNHLRARVTQARAQAVAPADLHRPLVDAARCGDLAAVRALLAAGTFTRHDLDLALARACLGPIEIARTLLEHGADPNGEYGDNYGPLVLVTCECHRPDALQLLLDHGADVHFSQRPTKYPAGNTPLAMALTTYERKDPAARHAVIDLLESAGTEVPDSPLMDVYRGRAESLARRLDGDPALLAARVDAPAANFPAGAAPCTHGLTLLHLAVELDERPIAELFLRRGGTPALNARAARGPTGAGLHTPLFHAIGSNQGAAFPLFELLLTYHPDLSIPALLPETLLNPAADKAALIPLAPRAYADHLTSAPAWCNATREATIRSALNAPLT